MVHHRCGRYSLAEDDFAAALKMDPTNKEFGALLMRSKEKKKEVEGEATHQKTKKKVMIQEVSDSEDEDEDEEEILELGADGFDISSAPSKPLDLDVVSNFISASKFKGKKAGMVFKLGEDGLGYYKDGKKGKKGKKEEAKPKKPKAIFKKVVIEESDSDEDSSDEEVDVKVNVKRATGNEKSIKLKDEGNAAMAKGDFKEAVRLYGER
jgi:hypothetical protein